MTQIERRELWRERVTAFRAAGGGNKAAWCREHELKIDQLRYWLERVPADADADAPSASVHWLAVRPDEPPAQTIAEDRLLVHVGRVAVEVRPGFNRALLTELVQALTLVC